MIPRRRPTARHLVSKLATHKRGDGRRSVAVVDAKSVVLKGRAQRPLYIDVPAEDPRSPTLPQGVGQWLGSKDSPPTPPPQLPLPSDSSAPGARRPRLAAFRPMPAPGPKLCIFFSVSHRALPVCGSDLSAPCAPAAAAPRVPEAAVIARPDHRALEGGRRLCKGGQKCALAYGLEHSFA